MSCLLRTRGEEDALCGRTTGCRTRWRGEAQVSLFHDAAAVARLSLVRLIFLHAVVRFCGEDSVLFHRYDAVEIALPVLTAAERRKTMFAAVPLSVRRIADNARMDGFRWRPVVRPRQKKSSLPLAPASLNRNAAQYPRVISSTLK